VAPDRLNHKNSNGSDDLKRITAALEPKRTPPLLRKAFGETGRQCLGGACRPPNRSCLMVSVAHEPIAINDLLECLTDVRWQIHEALDDLHATADSVAHGVAKRHRRDVAQGMHDNVDLIDYELSRIEELTAALLPARNAA